MKEEQGAILIIGGGITGIQAALDAVDLGFKVYLVEKTPSIGGHMAMLDKTFPTNDCSMCTLAPKMVEVLRHPNIELLTYSEVKKGEGEAGNFRVKILKKPRYVNEETCTGCGACAEVCPVEVPNEFNMYLDTRKAIYVPFPQAVPNVYTIDMENCKKCLLCEKKCESNSINHDQEPEEIEIEVGAIIVATGYKIFNPNEGREEFGYQVYKNVLTSLDLERILSASGPTGGEINRPSDKKKPKKIAFIQCVGSRDAQIGNAYCSQVCCMYTAKHSMLIKEKMPDTQNFVFYMDVRPYGKGCEKYYKRTKDEYGTQYIRSRVSDVQEKDNENLLLRYEDTVSGELDELEVDMLVLATAIRPNESNKEIAELLGIELDEYGFFKEIDISKPVRTNKPGIFVSGVAQGPMDIPDSIAQASSAVSEASALLAEIRSKAEEKKVEEIELIPKPRIGVFVCRCGGNISNVVDVEAATEYAKLLPNVVHASNHLFACSSDVQTTIKEIVKEKELNRVVVAACTPRTHEPLFRNTCAEVGLNPYLFEMANIRDQCSWVHSKYPDVATEKAKDLIRMAVAKARLLEPQEGEEIQIEPACLVVGGGISGLAASLLVSQQGFKTYLVERENRLGGMINDLYKIYPSEMDPNELLDPLIQAVKNQENIEVMKSTNVEEISGYIGNFDVNVKQNGFSKSFKVGTIIIATGAQEYKPIGLYNYGENSRVYTQLEIEDLLRKNELTDGETIVMIQCAGSRKEENITYCSRICCMTAIKNAQRIKEQYPNSKIYICYRDITMCGKGYEEYYAQAQEEFGVKFFRYTEDNEPKILDDTSDKPIVRVFDTLTQITIDIPSDRICLSTPLIPSEGTDFLSQMLKIPKGEDGFFFEAHMKLRPLDFASDGIYLCGTAHGPKDIVGSLSQAYGAAARATIPLAKGLIVTEGITAEVDSELCGGCGICEATCSYGAIAVTEEDDKRVAEVTEALCKGCGSCGAACPAGAITMKHFKDNQIEAMIRELLVGTS